MTVMQQEGRSLTQLIEDEVQKWAMRAQERKRQGRVTWPIITISREFGARGAALANCLGERLGFRVWDKSLLQAIAEESGGDRKVLELLDEQVRRGIDDAVIAASMGSRYSNTQYLRALMRVVHAISAHGNSIIVGRGANYIAKPKKSLTVRVVCPLDLRVKGYAERQQLTEKQARKHIEKMDAGRAQFVRHHFKHDGTEPADYDLTLNAATFTLDEMADLVLQAYEAKLNKRPPEVA